MKILFISAANSIHTVRWVNSLVKLGHEVHLAYNSDHLPKLDTFDEGIIHHQLKYTGVLAYYLNANQLNKIYKQITPDICNAHYASGYGTLARMARLKPLILSVWGTDVYEFPFSSKFKRNISIKNFKYADVIASTSHCMANLVRNILDKPNLDIKITPFGVDTKLFSKKNNINKDDCKIVIGNVKTLDPVYGIHYLIKAIRLLKDDYELKAISDYIVLHIYGDGFQKPELLQLTKDLKLEDIVEFKGKIPNIEVPIALEEMDIFCASSIQESFGVSVIEAMAMELPVVATNADGFNEVVLDNVTGIIVQKENPEAIAKGLKKLILNKHLRLEMGKQGRLRVIELFDWDKNVQTMVNIYNKYRRV